MPGVTNAGSIRLLLAGPLVLRTFGFALLGRLAYGVLPLCFLFTVREASGSFTIAAGSAATLGFATLAMPIQARLVDRFGQRRILPIFATAYACLLLLGAALAEVTSATAVWLGLGLLLGLSGPALGPAMRAQWREITVEGPQRRRAYSIDSVGEESLYLLGPIIAGIILVAGPAWVGLVLAAVLVGVGTTALALSPYRPMASPTDRPGGAPGPTARRPLLRPLQGVLASLSLFGAGSAAVFVGIAALAERADNPAIAGVIEAAMAAGAVAGGLLWARLGAAEASRRVLAVLLVCLAVAHAVTAVVASDLVLVCAVLAVGSLAASPVFVVSFSVADQAVAADQRTEASTWVTVSANAGSAAGIALAGLATGLGGAAPFVLAALLTCCAAVAALIRHPHSPPPHPARPPA